METFITANIPHILVASTLSFLILYITNHIKTIRDKTKEREKLEKKAARKVIDEMVPDFKKQKKKKIVENTKDKAMRLDDERFHNQ